MGWCRWKVEGGYSMLEALHSHLKGLDYRMFYASKGCWTLYFVSHKSLMIFCWILTILLLLKGCQGYQISEHAQKHFWSDDFKGEHLNGKSVIYATNAFPSFCLEILPLNENYMRAKYFISHHFTESEKRVNLKMII